MKLLHTSDWHLGMTFPGGSYLEDQRFAVGQICRIAREENADGMIIAGDVFDKSVASAEAHGLYDELLTHICGELGIPVYMIAGNHDSPERLAQLEGLLKKSGLYIAGSLRSEPYTVSSGDTDIYLLPWISTDRVKSVYPDTAGSVESLEDAYRALLDKYRESFSPGRKRVLVAHAYIVDGETSESDRAAELGGAATVGAGVFEGFDYVALGHLHGPQQISERIRYSGTFMPYSFGREEKQVKSVTLIDTDTGQQKIVPVPLLHKRATLTGTREELLRGDMDEDIRRGYVRLDVTDSYVGAELISRFREIYENPLETVGKSLEAEGSRVTMTAAEYENAAGDPESVFVRFCRDIMGREPEERWTELFGAALKEYEKEETEQ